jgi:hypothetical protein
MKIFAFVRRQMVPLVVLCCFAFFGSQPAQAQISKTDPGSNNPPPTGAILDLNGQPIPGGGNDTYQQYTVNFIAGVANTAITFAFREDPAFISFSNASVTDVTTQSNVNLLLNGNFAGGLSPWTYANQYGAAAGGVVFANCGVGLPGPTYGTGNCWYDGAVLAYDAISQTIATTIGDTYQISFWVADNSHCGSCNFSDLSTNSVPGKNVTVYAQTGLPSAGGPPTQTAPPQPITGGGTNPVQFNTATNNLVQHDLIWPFNLQFNNGVTNPQLLSTNIILSTVSGIGPFLEFTPWAVGQLFEKAGDDQTANGAGFGSLYRDKCFQFGQDPSTATEPNCPIGANSGDFINFSDVFDQPNPKPDIAPGTTVSLVHHFTQTSPSDVWAPVPSGAASNPVCTQVATSGATFNCELEDSLTYDPATFATSPGGVSGDETTIGGRKIGRGTMGSVFNVPMLQTAVKVNSKPVNTVLPEVQGTQQYWFNSHTLNLNFLVNPAQTSSPSNGWLAAPVNTLAYILFSNSTSEPPLPAPPNCPGDLCALASGTPGALPAAPVDFTSTQSVGADGLYTLAWSARDTVNIGERNIQLLHSLPSGASCPNPYGISPAPTPPCYSTTLFSALIGVDTLAPTMSTNFSGPVPVVLNGPGPTLNLTCTDPPPAGGGLQSGIQVCGTSPTTNVPSPGVASFTGSSGPLSTAKIGSNQVTGYAQDIAGNKASTVANYSVLYSTGNCLGNDPGHQIMPPINPNGTSVFWQSQIIAMNFRVCDAKGVSIGTPGVITNVGLQIGGKVDADAAQDVADILQETTFHYDTTHQYWTCTIHLSTLDVGFTYTFTISLNDGTTISYKFGVK